jgi:hypothetical protein
MNINNWQEYYLYSDEYDLYIKAPIDTDFDGTFLAYCLDNNEYIKVNGWLFNVCEKPTDDEYKLMTDIVGDL